ncbi:Bimodular acetylaranotin synthesis protein ataTC [Exophiala dermatitidis]
MLYYWSIVICGAAFVLCRAFLSPSSYQLWISISDAVTDCLSVVFDFILTRQNGILHRRTGKQIPSCPWKWPNGQGDVAKFLDGMENSELWGSDYGGCYRIWAGTSPEIVVSKPQHIKTAFHDSDKHLKAHNNDSGYLMSQVLGKCLGLVSGHEYATLRGLLEPYFTYSQSSCYLQRIQQRTDEWLLKKNIVNNGQKERLQLDPVNDFKFLPFLIVADILYGNISPEMEAQLLSMAPGRERLFQHVIGGGLSRFSVSKYLPTQANRTLHAFQQQWTKFNADAYERAIKEGYSEAIVVQLFEAAKRGSISWDHCNQTLDEMLFANLDVTMGALAWNLVHLADNLDVQSAVRDEIAKRTTLNGDVQVGSGLSGLSGEMKEYLQSSATLLAACMLESSRLRPLAAFTVPQAAPTDRVIDDYTIPARTSFVVDAFALNIRNDYWGEDRFSYRPQRFLDMSRSDTRYRYWRFGFGPRQCLGKYVAELILRTVTVRLLSRFILHVPASESKLWQRDRETWISQPKIKLELECL